MNKILTSLALGTSILLPTAAWEASVTQNLGITVTQSQSITSVNLSNSSFTGGVPSGTVVGAISVTMSPSAPPFSGSLALSGTDAGKFQIAGTNLATSGVIPAGTYQINIVPTEAGATGSGTAYPFTITGDLSSGLPPGVTLSAIDGETMTGNVMSHNYYARNGFTNAASSTFDPSYNNGGWDDPRFFPIGQDYSFYPSNSTATFKALGLNFTHRVTADTNLSTLKAAGIWALPAPGEGSNPGSETIGWHIEEPNAWSDIVSEVQSAGSGLTGRLLQISFTFNQLYYRTISGTPCGGTTMPYVMSCPISTSIGNVHLNVPGDDLYWFAASAAGSQQYQGGLIYKGGGGATADQMARGSNYGDMVDTMRPWLASYPAPVGAPYIETEDGLVGAGSRRITPPELNWAAWSTIVHGARWLLYFGTTSNFGTGSTFGFSQSILSGQSISMYNQAIATHTKVKNLAPILNSPFAINFASATPAGYTFPTRHIVWDNGIEIMAKYFTGGTYSNSTGTFGNGLYIFASVRGSAAQNNIGATFTIANTGKTSVPVVGEGRNVTVTNGGTQFTDTFANAYTVHIYGPF
jgi:hypothetical protein